MENPTAAPHFSEDDPNSCSQHLSSSLSGPCLPLLLTCLLFLFNHSESVYSFWVSHILDASRTFHMSPLQPSATYIPSSHLSRHSSVITFPREPCLNPWNWSHAFPMLSHVLCLSATPLKGNDLCTWLCPPLDCYLCEGPDTTSLFWYPLHLTQGLLWADTQCVFEE